MAHDDHDPRASSRPEAGAPATPAAASTLSEEHSLLLREVTTRAETLLRETDEGRWPDQQLTALVDYLHLEVLQQVVDEERLVFLSHRGAEGLAGLRLAHRELRAAIDVLAQALASTDTLTREQVGDCTRNLITQLADHLTAEEQVLATGDFQTPPTTTFGARPHEWYALTAGPVIDLDRLPGEAGFEAVLDRMLRLTPEEQVELRSGSDPDPIWQRISAADPGGYGCEILQQGEGHWRVQISRRPAP
ncbi:MAG: hemerythrin domain-containing protein [Jatrophihabitantaceae bacterium]